MVAYLVLNDGSVFKGKRFGAEVLSGGEVVFNTSMTGYQEVLTDPSYYGQMVVLTYPLIGNYGIDPQVSQSNGIKASGLIVGEYCEKPSHWKATQTLDSYLKANGIAGIAGIDTRALTKKIRDKGAMSGVIVNELSTAAEMLLNYQFGVAKDAVYKTSTQSKYQLPAIGKTVAHVAVMDFGIKQNILKTMQLKGYALTVYPADTKAQSVLETNPDGVFLSNGPGDPEQLKAIIEEVKILSAQKPTFGICLGHQLLCQAFGGQTKKLKFGHRGANHPVKDLALGRVFMTAQNHGYVVVDESLLESPVEVTHININDGSIEGVKHKKLPVFSVQYHPEAAPGPDDSVYLFDQFTQLMHAQKGGICHA